MIKTAHSSLSKKLSSYVTLASAFLAFGPGAGAQCGTADEANPILDVDINGDGVVDVSLIWNRSTSYGPSVGTASIGFIDTKTIQGSRYISFIKLPEYTTILGGTSCYAVSVPGATQGGGPNGSLYAVPGGNVQPYYFGNTATGTWTIVNYWFGQIDYSLSYNKIVRSSAYANAMTGNLVAGLFSDIGSVCGTAYQAGLSVGLGMNTKRYWSGIVNYDLNFLLGSVYGNLTASWPGASNYSCSIGTGNIPGIPSVPVSFGYLAPSGTFMPNVGSGTICINNVSSINYLAIRFKGPDSDGNGQSDTYNGWVEISVDPETSAVTCIGTGYNPCSIESANQLNGTADGCPPDADLQIGTTVTGLCGACDADNGELSITVRE